jgi:uncharacterized protein (TIGR02996 family)
MGIWFVYRSPYDGPASRHVKRLEGPDTLLGWFRSIWRAIPDMKESAAYAHGLFGTYVYSLGGIFSRIAREGLPPPETDDDLHGALESEMYIGGEFKATRDTIQVLTDDDELTMAMFWFTDAFAARHPERVAFLLHSDWRLPEGAGPGGFEPFPGVRKVWRKKKTPGDLYFVDLYWSDSSDLEDLNGAERLPGMRLEGFVPWLLTITEEKAEGMGIYFASGLRAPLAEVMLGGEGLEAAFRRTLAGDPGDAATWAAYSDWLHEQGLPRAEMHLLAEAVKVRHARWKGPGVGKEMLLQAGEHHLVYCMGRGAEDEYDQWILFDDVWASAHETLAQSILAYAWRYDVLSDWRVKGEYGCERPPLGGWRKGRA